MSVVVEGAVPEHKLSPPVAAALLQAARSLERLAILKAHLNAVLSICWRLEAILLRGRLEQSSNISFGCAENLGDVVIRRRVAIWEGILGHDVRRLSRVDLRPSAATTRDAGETYLTDVAREAVRHDQDLLREMVDPPPQLRTNLRPRRRQA